MAQPVGFAEQHQQQPDPTGCLWNPCWRGAWLLTDLLCAAAFHPKKKKQPWRGSDKAAPAPSSPVFVLVAAPAGLAPLGAAFHPPLCQRYVATITGCFSKAIPVSFGLAARHSCGSALCFQRTLRQREHTEPRAPCAGFSGFWDVGSSGG